MSNSTAVVIAVDPPPRIMLVRAKWRKPRLFARLHISGQRGNGSISLHTAIGAMLAGLAWTVSSIVSLAPAGGRGLEILGFVPLDEALYGVALVATLGGLVGLHAKQAPSYGRVGSVGFVMSFVGVSLLLVG